VKASLLWEETLKVYHFRGMKDKGKCRVDSRGLCDRADNCICSATDPSNRASENPCI